MKIFSQNLIVSIYIERHHVQLNYNTSRPRHVCGSPFHRVK